MKSRRKNARPFEHTGEYLRYWPIQVVGARAEIFLFIKIWLKQNPAICIAQEFGSRPFGMRHQANYIPVLITDSRDIPGASICIGCCGYISFFITIFPKNLAVGFQFIQYFIICKITAFPMRNRNFQWTAPLS